MPGNLTTIVHTLSVMAIPLLFAITLHEVAHGWMARRFGDRTAELMGRLSLNPLKHIDPVGTVIVPLLMYWYGNFIFGWAKPVPVNARALRNPRRDMIPVAAAGPIANVIMAIGWVLLYRFAGSFAAVPGAEWLSAMAREGLYFNILLASFNLIPLPPLDGARMLRGVVSEGFGRRLDAIEPYGLIIVVALLALGLLDEILGPIFDAVQGAVLWVAGVKGN